MSHVRCLGLLVLISVTLAQTSVGVSPAGLASAIQRGTFGMSLSNRTSSAGLFPVLQGSEMGKCVKEMVRPIVYRRRWWQHSRSFALTTTRFRKQFKICRFNLSKKFRKVYAVMKRVIQKGERRAKACARKGNTCTETKKVAKILRQWKWVARRHRRRSVQWCKAKFELYKIHSRLRFRHIGFKATYLLEKRLVHKLKLMAKQANRRCIKLGNNSIIRARREYRAARCRIAYRAHKRYLKTIRRTRAVFGRECAGHLVRKRCKARTIKWWRIQAKIAWRRHLHELTWRSYDRPHKICRRVRLLQRKLFKQITALRFFLKKTNTRKIECGKTRDHLYFMIKALFYVWSQLDVEKNSLQCKVCWPRLTPRQLFAKKFPTISGSYLINRQGDILVKKGLLAKWNDKNWLGYVLPAPPVRPTPQCQAKFIHSLHSVCVRQSFQIRYLSYVSQKLREFRASIASVQEQSKILKVERWLLSLKKGPSASQDSKAQLAFHRKARKAIFRARGVVRTAVSTLRRSQKTMRCSTCAWPKPPKTNLPKPEQ